MLESIVHVLWLRRYDLPNMHQSGNIFSNLDKGKKYEGQDLLLYPRGVFAQWLHVIVDFSDVLIIVMHEMSFTSSTLYYQKKIVKKTKFFGMLKGQAWIWRMVRFHGWARGIKTPLVGPVQVGFCVRLPTKRKLEEDFSGQALDLGCQFLHFSSTSIVHLASTPSCPSSQTQVRKVLISTNMLLFELCDEDYDWTCVWLDTRLQSIKEISGHGIRFQRILKSSQNCVVGDSGHPGGLPLGVTSCQGCRPVTPVFHQRRRDRQSDREPCRITIQGQQVCFFLITDMHYMLQGSSVGSYIF